MLLIGSCYSFYDFKLYLKIPKYKFVYIYNYIYYLVYYIIVNPKLFL